MSDSQWLDVPQTERGGPDARRGSEALGAESRPPSRLRVLVGVQDEGMNGIETYAEQVALAAAAAGHHVTLLITTAQAAEAVRLRTRDAGVHVVDAGLVPKTKREILAERFLPQLQTRRVGQGLAKSIKAGLVNFDVVHLNRAGLAPWAQGAAAKIFGTGWFYPHSPGLRMTETWKHTDGPIARRLVLTAKSVAYYLGDRQGYRSTETVIACTETLAEQLRTQGIRAVCCPPPVSVTPLEAEDTRSSAGALQLLVCSGDLSHPRKNLRDAVRVARRLAQLQPERPVVLRAIGNNPGVLQREAATLPRGATLELLGPKPSNEVHAEMRRAHAFLLPSLYEEWGYVGVEAVLSGTPVATYPVYPFADMLSGGLGVLAEDMTLGAYASAVERAASMPHGRPLAEAGALRFGHAAIGERLTRIWSDAVSAA